MTDKQIIIDVTQCPYYKEDKTCTYLPYKSKCEGDCNWTSYKEMEEQLKAKEQECEELKETFDGLLKVQYKLADNCKKLRQCLTEIKEIAEEAGNTQYLTFPDFDLKQNAKMLMGQFNGYLQQILQKISECEGNDELTK